MRSLLASFAVLLMLVDCSSPSSSVSRAQACADQSRAACEKRDQCSNGSGATANGSFINIVTYGSEPDCESQLTEQCISALGAPGTGQSTGNIETCVGQYASYTCTDYRDSNPSAACIPPAGGLGNNTPCGASAQCASTFCHLTQFAVCGTCQPLPAVGTACTYSGDCGRDMACAIQTGATSGTCALFVGGGGACLPDVNPCEGGYDCVGSDATTNTMGACLAQATEVGAACDRSSKTAANCDYYLGLTCIPTSSSGVGTCQSISVVAAGAPCGTVFTTTAPKIAVSEAVCGSGGECITDATTGTSTCVPYAPVGAPCDGDPTIGPPCLAPARCVPTSGGTAGLCAYPNAATCQ